MTDCTQQTLLDAVAAAVNADPYCGTTLAEAQTRAAEAWGARRGLVRARRRRPRPCLLDFANRECETRRNSGASCWGCTRPYLDHVSYWARSADAVPNVLVAHPYGDVTNAALDAAMLGLRCEVAAETSWHNPGRTVLVTFTKQ